MGRRLSERQRFGTTRTRANASVRNMPHAPPEAACSVGAGYADRADNARFNCQATGGNAGRENSGQAGARNNWTEWPNGEWLTARSPLSTLYSPLSSRAFELPVEILTGKDQLGRPAVRTVVAVLGQVPAVEQGRDFRRSEGVARLDRRLAG